MSEYYDSIYDNSEYPSRRHPSEQGSSSSPKRPRKKRRRGGDREGHGVVSTILLVMLCTGLLLCGFLMIYIKTVIVPYAELSLDDYPLGENSIMYYQDKETGEYKEMVKLLSATSSTWVDYEDMPKNLVNAAVAIEDQRFWEHPGIDWRRTGKAVLDMFAGNNISGGSTITQQLIKNLTDYNETTVKRKIIEIVRALRFTENNSKEDTITYYLNIIPLGSGCEGVGSASYKYFGKPVSDLDLAECASLISITNNPSRYSPYSDARSETKDGEVWDAVQWNKWRQEKVLKKMLELEMIDKQEYEDAVNEELVFVQRDDEKGSSTVYSWYEETVLADVKRDLKEKLKWSDKRITQFLARGGLRIYTCMDPRIQDIAEKVYTNRSNLNYTSANGHPMQSSITIIDNSTGDLVAIVGQFGDKKQNLLTNFANTGKRQPGSSIKPLTVYSPAIDMGLISPISIVDDYPYQVLNGRAWPTNSGAARYKGLSTVRRGLEDSVNTIAVRILADKVTPAESFKFAENKYHLDLVKSEKIGNHTASDLAVAPLAMGGLTHGVSTRDMAEAFATFPSNGVYTESRTYSKITMLVDGEEHILLENPPQQEQVIKETTAYYMNSMLQDVVKSGTAAGHGVKGVRSAGKTGTTSHNYDRWFVGYTPYYTAAVWTGYDQGNEKIRARGNPALNLWEKVMDQIHVGMKNTNFPIPDGLKSVNFCLDSGYEATKYCRMDPRGSRVGSDKVFKEDYPKGGTCPIHRPENVLTVCLDDPILDSNGNPTGLYHIAGPYCTHTTQICLPDYDRKHIAGASAGDEIYRKSYVEAQGPCRIHTHEQPPEPEEPVDPEEPLDPNAPVDPNVPVDPDNPDVPVIPDNPGTEPEIPDPEPKPDTSQKPVEPDNPPPEGGGNSGSDD